MVSISRFVLQKNNTALTIDTDEPTTQWQFNCEYLRVFTPAQIASKEIIGNKKGVALNSIENVGKHGFRLNFNDDHSCIFDIETFIDLAQYYDRNWQKYLELLSENKLTREARIDILNLS